MEFETTFTATESRTFAVPFVGMPTVRALLRSVSSIHEKNVLSKSFSFVTDKLLKLVERPVIELAVTTTWQRGRVGVAKLVVEMEAVR